MEKKLTDLVANFLSSEIDANLFEEKFSEVYDLEDLEFTKSQAQYFRNVRELLARYTPYREDLKNYPEYYIDAVKLKEKIKLL